VRTTAAVKIHAAAGAQTRRPGGRPDALVLLDSDRHSLVSGADGMNNTRSWPTSRTPSRRRDGEYVEMGILQLAAGDYQSSSGRARPHWSRVRGHVFVRSILPTSHAQTHRILPVGNLSLCACLRTLRRPRSIHLPPLL